MTNVKIIVVGEHALKWLTKARERDGESGEWQHKNKVGKGKYLKIFLHYARKRMPKGTQPMLSKAMIFLGQLHFSTNSQPIESTCVFHSYGLRNARTIHTYHGSSVAATSKCDVVRIPAHKHMWIIHKLHIEFIKHA